MHREFRKRLAEARGESRNVVAAFFDIRGFSAFNTKVDAVDSASYVRRVYTQVLDTYFPSASFFKPTGDGLMIIHDYEAETVRETVRHVVTASLRLGSEFKAIAAGDPMVNFPVPDKAGFGIARGSACCLVSHGRILDYSGRHLNLAARLLNLARPHGVVMDGAIGLELLEDSTQALFEPTTAVIRGIAERGPGIPIYYTKGLTTVPEAARRSIDEGPLVTRNLSYETLRKFGEAGNYRIPLEKKPRDSDNIRVTINHPKISTGGRPHRTLRAWDSAKTEEFYYREFGGRPYLILKRGVIADRLRAKGVKDSWSIGVDLEYEAT